MMTWLKLLVRRQNHQSNEMNRHSAFGKQKSATSHYLSAALSIDEDNERRSTRPSEKRVVFIETSTDCNNKTSAAISRIVAPVEDPTSSMEEMKNIAKSIQTAQKVRLTSAVSQPASISCGGSKSRDRRRGCLATICPQSMALSSGSVSVSATASSSPSSSSSVSIAVEPSQNKLPDARLAETKELRLPKLVQEQHETSRCQCTKSDSDNKNMHKIKSCWPAMDNQKLREGLREGQSLTNCQVLGMMKVAPRATRFHCDKTPAFEFAPPCRPLDENSKTSQVVEEDEEEYEKRSASKLQQQNNTLFVTSHQQLERKKQNENNNNCNKRPLESTSSVLFKPKSKRQRRGHQPTRSLEISPTPILSASGGRPTRSLMLIANCCLVAIALLAVNGLESPSKTLVFAAEAPKQSITVHPEQKYFVPAGQQVKLPCQVANRQGDCAWLGTGGKIVSPSGRKYIFARSPSDGDCSILIRNASVVADDGLWQCQALASEGELDMLQQSRSTQLVVLVPPERPQIKDLSQRTNRLILEEKKEKNITCEIRGGNPAPQIEWYLDGKLINQNVQTNEQKLTPGDEQQKSPALRLVQSRLLLNNVKRSMNGKNLTCVGVHQTQNQSASIELDVQYVPSASLAQKEYTLVEGSPLTVPCLVDANPPASHITWRFINTDPSAAKGEAIMTAKTGPILEVNQVSRAYNRVLYECLAQNSLGISRPAEMRLNVLYPPRALNATESGHVFVGTSKHLHCAFDGNPQPEIKWFYQDPLSRSATSVLIDNSKDWDQQAKSLADQQSLSIRNVTYRNEGEYVCEARNVINGQTNTIRSSPINLDVIGEPQFLAKSPVHAKAVQGSKSDISLTFCADPPPTKVYWQFGSIRVEVKIPTNGADQRAPSVGQLSARHQQALNSRYQTQPLQSLQKRESSFSKPATCFESTLTLIEPEMSDQRDYSLMVQNDQGVSSGFVRVRVTSPLSPALMITSAFVFICGLFLCSLFFLFIFKKRQQFMSGARRANNGSVHSSQTNGTSNGANSNERRRNGNRKDKNLLVVAGELATGGQPNKSNGTNGQSNGHQQTNQQSQHNMNNNGQQQQTKGVVNGTANGLANGAINPAVSMLNAAGQLVLDEHQPTTKGLVHGLMSMASSDTSCNDQKQLLASNCSDRNSSVGGGSSNGVAIDVGTSSDHYHHHHHHHNNNTNTTTSSGNTTGRSTANSSPSPMNHISVDDELNLNGTYQATEPITQGARLSPQIGINGGMSQSNHHLDGQNALIYANIDYANPNRLDANGDNHDEDDDDDSYNGHVESHHQDMRRGQQQQQHSPDASTMTLNKKSASLLAQRRRQQTPQLSPSGSSSTVQENFHHQQRPRSPLDDGSPVPAGSIAARPSVGATIALMNSLAAAQSVVSSPVNNGTANQTGVLNGAISQQLMANSANRVRKPGPPKPPKPSIQQRSRFYQQQQQLQQQANNSGGGLVMIGDSQLGVYPMSADEKIETQDESSGAGPNDLAVEYSRLAFPARAEL